MAFLTHAEMEETKASNIPVAGRGLREILRLRKSKRVKESERKSTSTSKRREKKERRNEKKNWRKELAIHHFTARIRMQPVSLLGEGAWQLACRPRGSAPSCPCRPRSISQERPSKMGISPAWDGRSDQEGTTRNGTHRQERDSERVPPSSAESESFEAGLTKVTQAGSSGEHGR